MGGLLRYGDLVRGEGHGLTGAIEERGAAIQENCAMVFTLYCRDCVLDCWVLTRSRRRVGQEAVLDVVDTTKRHGLARPFS